VAGLSLLWPASGAAATGNSLGWMWRGALASFYGAIVEEIQSRLLLVSVFVWLLARLSRGPPGTWIFVAAIVLAALLFGAGHLPAAFAAGLARGPVQIARIVVLNTLAGIVFGVFYWKLGLEHAMVAHVCADLLLHVAVPALSGATA
jgi:Type II CAAX prenyl endopeptidase Rce1-like